MALTQEEIKTLYQIRAQSGPTHGLELPSGQALTTTTGALTVKFETVVVRDGVDCIDFRGEGVLATIDGATGEKEVVVFIPRPDFVSHFNSTDGNNDATVAATPTSPRRVSAPTAEGNPFNISPWAAGSTRDVLNENFIYTTNDSFSIFDDSSTMITVKIFDADGTTVLATNSLFITGDVDNTNNNIRIIITGFVANGFKQQADLEVRIDIDAIIPAGGKFNVEIKHDDFTEGAFTFTQNDLFFDRNTVQPSIGTVAIAENVPVIKDLSGVMFYTLGSTFTINITDIDDLNDESFPAIQVQVEGPEYGLPNLDLAGEALTGWTTAFDDTGSSYTNAAWAITQTNFFTTTTTANVQAKTFDWITGTPVVSTDTSLVIDTYSPDNSTRIFEDFRTESRRLESDLSTVWDSTQDLGTYDDTLGLQLLDSKLIYPTLDWSPYAPNAASQPDYSALAGDRTYIRKMFHTGVSHSNGIFQFGNHNITEAFLTAEDFLLEISLDGVDFFIVNRDYLGGILSDGDGCRINPETSNMSNNKIEFTFGLAKQTLVGTAWGIYVKVTYKDTVDGKNMSLGILEITNWI